MIDESIHSEINDAADEPGATDHVYAATIDGDVGRIDLTSRELVEAMARASGLRPRANAQRACLTDCDSGRASQEPTRKLFRCTKAVAEAAEQLGK